VFGGAPPPHALIKSAIASAGRIANFFMNRPEIWDKNDRL
jgi:hypothetical protein